MKQKQDQPSAGSTSGVSSNALALLAELEGDPALAKRLRGALGGKRSWPRWQVWTTAALVSVFTGVTGVAAAPGVDEFFTFSGGTPARASEVNANFALTQTWLEEKSGPVCNGSPCNTSVSGDATITGSVSAGAGTLRSLVFSGTDSSINTSIDPAEVFQADSDASYERVNADSLHTNGNGLGQLYMEGTAIDSQFGDLLLNGRNAGPDADPTQHAVIVGGGMTINGDTSTGGTMGLGGLLTLSVDSVDTDSNTNGCSRVGSVQTCWYQVNATGAGALLTWDKAFGNNDYVVVASAEVNNDGRMINVTDINDGNARFRCRSHSGNGENCRAHVIAIGLAGTGW